MIINNDSPEPQDSGTYYIYHDDDNMIAMLRKIFLFDSRRWVCEDKAMTWNSVKSLFDGDRIVKK